jgi:hypothetical protein
MRSIDRSDRHKINLFKRQAIQVAGMLPDDPRDALMVLQYAKEIIETTFESEIEEAGDMQQPETAGLILVMQPRHPGRSGDGGG